MAKKATNKTTQKKTDIQKRELTSDEQQRMDKYNERAKKQPVKFKTVETDSGNRTVAPQDTDDNMSIVKLMEAMGTPDRELQSYLLHQVMQTFKVVKDVNKEMASIANNALVILSGIQPQDEIEGMLAVQMIGVHNMAMDCAARAMRTDRVDFMSTYMNGATKMLRTFAAQMEALKKYRTGGQQKMTVEHVHVNEGGQAIVGTVNQGGGGKNENCE